MDRSMVVERSRAQLPLLKINQGAVVRLKVLPLGPCWFNVHWIGRRQVLCSGCSEHGCEACGVSGSRVVGFVLCTTLLLGKERLFLLEVSPLAINSFEMSAKFESLSVTDCLWCDVIRPGSRRPLRFEVVEASSVSETFDRGLGRLANAVAVLYGLPLMSVGEKVSDWEERVAVVVAAHARRAVSEFEKRSV
jgi:hypothetical protein